ncbi:MAG: Holliday junction branch migration protein RuvA [Mycoplasmataceae bacterium]|nr:Holliday junction branch migration protein RuvA [Mycoplasmataceae bacterium]
MELYRKGKIISLGKTYIIVETNNTGNIIYVARPKDFVVDKLTKIYIYEHKSEYTEATYGFNTFKERILFENLLSVNGVGPKTALNILKEGVDAPISFIASGNVKAISAFPSLGTKTAAQIIFELKDKYKNADIPKGTISTFEVRDSLKTLGFNERQIKYAIQNIKPEKTLERMIENAIISISNANFA